MNCSKEETICIKILTKSGWLLSKDSLYIYIRYYTCNIFVVNSYHVIFYLNIMDANKKTKTYTLEEKLQTYT